MSKQESIRLALVVSEFNSYFTEKLLTGAIETLKSKGIDDKNYKVVKVPGAFEIPLISKKLAESGKYDAIIALGAVIRGDTYHYELVCDQVAAGVLKVSLDSGVPVIFGVITTENEMQAEDRAGGKEGNKGSDAVLAAIKMLNVMRDE
jgi:6,7-dimethyl-8-ribityllumazine synthase